MEFKIAKNLINKNRLDLVVKYLYAKEFLESENNAYSTGVYKDLYIRHILMRTMGIEPVDSYRNEISEKNNIDNYVDSFHNLIMSIKEQGYNVNYPIPLSSDGLLENGAHRVAVASLFDMDIPIENAKQGWSWDFDWFNDNGFNVEDKQRILKGFTDIHSDKCAIFVVWNPLFKYVDNVKNVLSNYFEIVGDVDLDFEDNYIAFTNALLEIYEPNISKNNDETVIREKAKLLQASYLSFKVIVVTNQNKNANKSISELSKICKKDIRDLFNHLLPKECFCTVHSSDDEAECRYLASILLSPNNIKHLKMRLTTESGHNFVRRIRNLPSFLKTIEIFDPNDICVIGSGVMTALGVQKDSDSDLDFIIDYKYRDKFGWNTVFLNDDYDIGMSDKIAQRPKNIQDNILIHNDEYHFWFKGIKFANLEIIKDRKILSSRPKDLVHLRQIELFEKMQGHLEQQKILLERIEAEKQRRVQQQAIQIQTNSKLKYSNLLERIFSIKNEISNNKKYKVLTILWIKIKLKRR